MPGKLARRYESFAREYVVDLNGSRAAIAAGYSEKTAAAQASRLLTKSNIKERVAELQKAYFDKCGITAQLVLAEIAKLGFANMRDYIKVQDGDAYVDLSTLTRDQAAAIQEITVEEYTEGRGELARNVKKTRFKLAEKRGSLELLGRHLKLFTDKVDMTGPNGEPFKVIVEHIAANSTAA